jgi:hypothetical protein
LVSDAWSRLDLPAEVRRGAERRGEERRGEESRSSSSADTP